MKGTLTELHDFSKPEPQRLEGIKLIFRIEEGSEEEDRAKLREIIRATLNHERFSIEL